MNPLLLPFRERFAGKPISRRLIICLFLCVMTLLAYIQVKDFSFIKCDDDAYVTENPVVKEGLTWEGVAWSFGSLHAANWHPLTWLSHMLDVQLFQTRPAGHHLTNLVLHVINMILLFLFLGEVTGAVWSSAFVAALFAIHPMHVESVAWVAERKDVLSTFFWFASLSAYAWYAKRPAVARYVWLFILFALGLMAKPMLVTLPFVLLLMDYWPLNRLSGGIPPAMPTNGWNGKRLLQLATEKIPLFVLSILSCMITIKAQRGGGAMVSMLNLSLSDRIENSLVSYVEYMLKLFWPFPMAYLYPLVKIPAWQFVGAAILLLVVSSLALYYIRRYPYLAVGWLWYLGTLVPVIGVVQVGVQSMADRYTYVPFIGLFVILAWGPSDALQGWKYRRIASSIAATAVLAACFVATWIQVGTWKSSETVFTHAMKVTENNYLAYNHMGIAYMDAEKYEQAHFMFKKAISIDPLYSNGYNNIGCLFALQGRLEEAAESFKTAIRIDPNDISRYRNLAVIYSKQGKTQEAEAVMAKIRQLNGS